LFRDYCYLASEYLLEPCDISFRNTKDYGLARDVLPQNIALPLVTLANKIGCFPFLEYAYCYALYNYYKVDPNGGMNFDNLRAIRYFEGSKCENGFILTHVIMDAFSNRLVTGIQAAFDAAQDNNRKEFNKALKELEDTMQIINNNFEQMWYNSKSTSYNNIRTFILGVKSQSFFPNGVVYEGVGDDKPRFYRGETGANDSIIPTMDNFV
jgi:indoleamine 2,3-dioxygenase